jgi:hypothetical protein
MSYKHFYPWQQITRRSGLRLTHTFDRNFDVARLQSELKEVLDHYEVVPHYRPYLANGWGAITLVGPNGDPSDHRAIQIVKGDAVEYRSTPVMRLTPYIESILATFPGAHYRVRLMRLEAGKRIFWHHDGGLFGLDRQVARFHVPIVTNPDVSLQVSHEDCHWQAGRLYFLDNSFPHRLVNAGDRDRIHLVIDLQVTPELLAAFPPVFGEQNGQIPAVRRRCTRWLDATVGNLQRFQKRWARKRQRMQQAWRRVRSRQPAVPTQGDRASVR